MRQKRKILIVTFNSLAKKSGGGIASRLVVNMIAELADECILVYPGSGKPDNICCNENVVLHPCNDKRPRWRKGLDVYRGVIHRFGPLTKRLFDQHKPDIVIFDTSIVSYGIIRYIKASNTRVVTIHHNVEADYYRSNKPPLAVRLPFRYFISRAERLSLLHSNLNLTLTRLDIARFSGLYSKEINKVSLQYLGIYGEPYKERYTPVPGLKSLAGRSIQFIITGSLSFPQSEESIIDFVDRYLPILENRIPDYKVIVAGSHPTARLRRKLSGSAHVDLVADPENLMACIVKADVYICPVDRGSGIKLRIMDALKAGLPVISHENSCSGYEKFVEMGYVLSYNSPQDFPACLNKIADMEIDSQKISKTYYEEFSFRKGVKRMQEIMESVLG